MREYISEMIFDFYPNADGRKRAEYRQNRDTLKFAGT
jgi:hypothetical protein